jgi:hypothetical protein
MDLDPVRSTPKKSIAGAQQHAARRRQNLKAIFPNTSRRMKISVSARKIAQRLLGKISFKSCQVILRSAFLNACVPEQQPRKVVVALRVLCATDSTPRMDHSQQNKHQQVSLAHR